MQLLVSAYYYVIESVMQCADYIPAILAVVTFLFPFVTKGGGKETAKE